MGQQKKAVRPKIYRSAIIIAVTILVVISGISFFVFRKEAYELQQNIYFMEWDYQEKITTFYRYSPEDDEVTKLESIEGKMEHCVVNKDETCITAICENGECVWYDLVTGTLRTEEIDFLSGESAKFLYDGGNKLLINSGGSTGHERWTFYSLFSKSYYMEEYVTVEDSGDKADRFLAVNDNEVWYVSRQGTLYRYDWITDVRTEILDSFESAAVASDTGLVAYIEEEVRKVKYVGMI